jgi:hypothetical protein
MFVPKGVCLVEQGQPDCNSHVPSQRRLARPGTGRARRGCFFAEAVATPSACHPCDVRYFFAGAAGADEASAFQVSRIMSHFPSLFL